MNVIQISVSAGRTFNHPHEDYSNLRPEVTMTATLTPADDYEKSIKTLQEQAETLVEGHKQAMLKSIDELHQYAQAKDRVQRLQSTIRAARQELDYTAKRYPQLSSDELGGGSETPSDEQPATSDDF